MYNLEMEGKSPLVSIIIPAYNEELVLERLLISIKNQIYPKIEIIVVDDASTDETYEIAKRYTKEVYKRKHAERSVQRNFGATKAMGKYLLFLDADMELENGVIEECVAKIESDKRIGAIVIPEVSVTSNFWEKVKAFERSFYNLEGDSTTDAARFFSMKAFNKAGGYDESITGPEDWDLPETVKKLGYKLGRITAKINHFERIPSLKSLVKKKYYYALKSSRYLSKHAISVVSPKTIYFLRPVFLKNYTKLLANPVLSVAMLIMLTFELIGGSAGYLIGRIRHG